MKTRKPLILTARIAETDLEPFDRLRKAHFPSDRNFLRAHLTMFQRLPGEHLERIVGELQSAATKRGQIRAEVASVRHLGAGVAFTIRSLALEQLYAELRTAFMPWLGGQDMQGWQPGSVAKIPLMSERTPKICSETIDERFQVAPFSG
ncbi:2'-5' RNA ligase family protein [Ensifer sp. Root278]|uniref:2'-5' RNA ligase family protein n=1 Tax=Ensifer sp. Root278 TaxID=1736509 RepID=UPI0007108BA9|nr:2'-5' RNA ligase family protein [Ensifer sp. Root278]KRD72154.1 hypothetical protein ASE60_23210 [Ensifer sp. Root278]